MDALLHAALVATAAIGILTILRTLRAFSREVRHEIRARRTALHGREPGSNSRESAKENVVAVLHRDGQSREIH